MIVSKNQNPVLSNPNWSVFILLVTLLAALNSLAIVVLPLSSDAQSLLRFSNLAISLLLWGDFFSQLRQAPARREFMGRQRGWMLLLGSFPLLRILRILWFRTHLRAGGYSFRKFLSHVAIRRNAQGTLLLILLAAITIFQVAIVSILSFEDASPESNITTVSDAIWWAFSTIATVGYGDRYPVTNGGRIIAILLMLSGIALVSVITGSLVEWFRESQSDRLVATILGQAEDPTEAVAEIKKILEQQENTYLESIDDLKTRLAELEASL